jgi:anion-transporting  ArsA/GET3 family ATPase
LKEEGLSLIDLVSDLQIVLVAGSGGVGKTTTSAALGVALATSLEKKVLVITIDPAKRLAGAMGIDALSHVPQEVQLKDAKGHLFAAMVDMKASWDEQKRKKVKKNKKREKKKKSKNKRKQTYKKK